MMTWGIFTSARVIQKAKGIISNEEIGSLLPRQVTFVFTWLYSFTSPVLLQLKANRLIDFVLSTARR